MNRDMLSRRLIKKDYEVSCIGREQALEMARASPYLILMDISLPGWTAGKHRRLKAMPETGHPHHRPHRHAMAGDREKCLEAGCDDTIPSRWSFLVSWANSGIVGLING